MLVIDDEDDVTDPRATTLVLAGYRVVVAYNGLDGLTQVANEQPQLIILGIRMPYLNGIAFIDRLQHNQATAAIPLIMMSAAVHPHHLPAHVIFIPKPFDLDQLLWIIEEQLARAQRPEDA